MQIEVSIRIVKRKCIYTFFRKKGIEKKEKSMLGSKLHLQDKKTKEY